MATYTAVPRRREPYRNNLDPLTTSLAKKLTATGRTRTFGAFHDELHNTIVAREGQHLPSFTIEFAEV